LKNALWLVLGVALGAVVAHQASKTPQGRQFFDEIDTKTREFTDAVLEGYQQREAELRAAVAEAEETIADLTDRLK